MAVQVEVDPSAFDQHAVLRGLSLGHYEFPFPQCRPGRQPLKLVSSPPHLRILSVGRPHATGPKISSSRLEDWSPPAASRFQQPVRLRFFRKLGFDLDPFRSSPEMLPRPCRVRAIFSGQIDHQANGHGPMPAMIVRAAQLSRSWQVFDVGFRCVVALFFSDLYVLAMNPAIC